LRATTIEEVLENDIAEKDFMGQPRKNVAIVSSFEWLSNFNPPNIFL